MKLLLLLPLLLLAGCGLFKETVTEYVPVYTKVQCPYLEKIEPIDTIPVKFVKATDQKGNIVAGLSGRDYTALSINSSRTLNYIIEQNFAIEYYVGCIDKHNAQVEKKEGEQ